MATADAKLHAVNRMVDYARSDLWSNPRQAMHVVDRFDSIIERGLAAWTADLPYPIASALWTLETTRTNVHVSHRQVFLDGKPPQLSWEQS